MNHDLTSRRTFLKQGGALLGAAALTGPAAFAAATKPAASAPEVSPLEDLMREHGLLARVILIYGTVRQRLMAGRPIPPQALPGAVEIVRSFVEDYHEKLEEEFIFPRFEQANQQVELVKVLRAQHQAGRRLTDFLTRGAKGLATADTPARRELAGQIYAFNQMYRPHKAREDTVLFPAFHALVTAAEYDALGDKFEARETQLFGEAGFAKMVAKAAEIEQSLGIYDLASFTPKVTPAGVSEA